MASTTWRFEQLGGKKHVLELSDHAAPHGRPRRNPVSTEQLTLREAEVYYDGDAPVTRHLFGLRYEPITFSGRFSDYRGGKGFARAKDIEVKRFVAEQQQLVVNWDDIVVVTGLLTHYKAERESEGEIAWELELKVDQDHILPVRFKKPTLPAPGHMQALIDATLALDKLALKTPVTLKGGPLDLLESAISAVNEVSSSLNTAIDQLGSFQDATFTDLRRFTAGLQQFRTAMVKLFMLYDSFESSAALEYDDAAEAVRFWDVQSAWAESSIDALVAASDAEKAAAEAQRGLVLEIYTANDGDTWESIAASAYGSADRAGELREANSVPAGFAPVAGTDYVVPI